MNYKMVFSTLGKMLLCEAVMLLLPLVVSLIYQENTWWAFLATSGILTVCGLLLFFLFKPEKRMLFSKDGFAIVGLSWIAISLFGCLPFIFSGEIPNFVDAFFETVSGFTTTGATILTNIEGLSKGMLFWRSFTHWIGGMGVLVFILAVLPTSEGQSIFIMKAESTGPQVGKLVSKIKSSARILYLLYIGLTVLETILLLVGGMSLYDSIVHSLATAGTGGFSVYNDSVAHFDTYSQIVIAIFMILFGINFNIFFLMIIGRFKQVLKSEELWVYLGIIAVSTVSIAANLIHASGMAVGLAFKDSFFQVASIITTTGFATADFDTWPMISKAIIVILMFIGGCAGSTGGGLKVARVTILTKAARKEIKQLVHPNSVTNIHFEGQSLDDNIVHGVTGYFGLFMIILSIAFVLIAFDPSTDFECALTGVITCLNNVGPGLGKLGPTCNFGFLTWFSKIVLSICMLIGRLEIYPILILLVPGIWKKSKNSSAK